MFSNSSLYCRNKKFLERNLKYISLPHFENFVLKQTTLEETLKKKDKAFYSLKCQDNPQNISSVSTLKQNPDSTLTKKFQEGNKRGQTLVYRHGDKKPYLGSNSLGSFRIEYEKNDIIRHSYINGCLARTCLYYKEGENKPFRARNHHGCFTIEYLDGIEMHSFISGSLEGECYFFRPEERRPFRVKDKEGTFEISYNEKDNLETHVYTEGRFCGQTLIFRIGEARPIFGCDTLGREFEIHYYDSENIVIHLYTSEKHKGQSLCYRLEDDKPFHGTDKFGRHFEITYNDKGRPKHKLIKNPDLCQ